MCGAMARIKEIRDLCEKRGLVLIEDACQAIGATFEGKFLGTFGQMGCFSFDPVKTITCGEGGAIVTKSQELYKTADAYADHGHDHVGNDRGLEGHAIIGSNFRISELNAAVGLAQLRKLDFILTKQRKNKSIIKRALEKSPEITFRTIPDEGGDSSTFLSFLLPDEKRAREVAGSLTNAGVDSCFYWYDNNWHYIKKWDHIRNLKSASKISVSLLKELPDYVNISLPQSDGIISRAISMQIKLSWTDEAIHERIEKMLSVLAD